jgi:hypothetical protein
VSQIFRNRELFIPIRVKSDWMKTVLLIAVIAGLLFAQQYLAAEAKGPVSESIVLALVLLAFLTAVIGVLGLKKPV